MKYSLANIKKSLKNMKNKKQILSEKEETGLLSEKNIKSQK